ncbi:MAG: sugar phosphate isomerase/epimerase family protein, partial [Egibacteraceae bacterium]
VLAADTGGRGYDTSAELGNDQWRRLLSGLDAATDVAGAHGLLAVLHPHVGTVVERAPHVERILDGSDIPLCLDTGHQLIGGIDPVALAKHAGDRIRHVQLKDVDADLAEQVAVGHTNYTDAVRAGLYRPLGDGDIDVPAIVELLDAAGFDGWVVLEQDLVLDAEPPPDAGPIDDARRSLTYLHSVLR